MSDLDRAEAEVWEDIEWMFRDAEEVIQAVVGTADKALYQYVVYLYNKAKSMADNAQTLLTDKEEYMQNLAKEIDKADRYNRMLDEQLKSAEYDLFKCNINGQGYAELQSRVNVLKNIPREDTSKLKEELRNMEPEIEALKNNYEHWAKRARAAHNVAESSDAFRQATNTINKAATEVIQQTKRIMRR